MAVRRRAEAQGCAIKGGDLQWGAAQQSGVAELNVSDSVTADRRATLAAGPPHSGSGMDPLYFPGFPDCEGGDLVAPRNSQGRRHDSGIESEFGPVPEGEAVRDNLDAPNWHIDIHEQVELHAPNSRKRRKQKSAKERIGEYGKFVPCGRDDENMGGERPSLGQQQRAKRSQIKNKIRYVVDICIAAEAGEESNQRRPVDAIAFKSGLVPVSIRFLR
ncbi:hypothetical protein AK812_SmicGene41507 [Symbiodinium microadriaticum]|uniref:Uncharacterized protein n=1 Tax=Symbiodinium microadriaticum TaxID=2951 RepID=A0A1Q9C5Z6_SYMMI|nr:hypothetical protein AK812_SmicGene41507 [Symbiodinium microadriaticum]